MNRAAAPRGSSAPSNSKPGVPTTAKRQRRAGALSDVTNLLPAADAPTPITTTAKRPRRAAGAGALCDVTNLLSAAGAPAPTKPKPTTRRKMLLQLLQQQKQQQASSPSDASSTCSSPVCVTPAAPKRSFAAGLEAEGTAVKSPAISTVYARRGAATEARGRGRKGALTTTDKGKGKGKEPVASTTASNADGTPILPQLVKSTGNRSRKTTVVQDTWSFSASSPCHSEAKKRQLSASTPKLPDDFVREKRAYFAEIDAFELPEEEVSESDFD